MTSSCERPAQPRVLIVDDDPTTRLLARETLEQAGFVVVDAADGEAALAVLEGGEPDLVLLDVDMPGIDGFEVCRRMRAIADAARLPIVMITGLDDTVSISRAYEHGATDFISKPINWPILGHRARYVLRSAYTMRDLHAAQVRMHEALVVFEASGQGIMTTDAKGVITSMNPAMCAITGYAAHEAIGGKPSLFHSNRHDASFYAALWATLLSTGRWEGEIWNRRKNGEIYPQWLSISAVRDAEGKIVEYVALGSDITQRKQQEEAVWRQANFDPLTGLANRNLLHDRLERALSRAQRNEKKVGLMFVDLDGFKWINDTLGHHVGDELLVQVARRLRSCVREQDTAARLGGDEFTLVIQDVADGEDLLPIGEKVVSLLSTPFTLAGSAHQLSGSVGITVYPDDADNVPDLFRNADIAMYKAKEAGKNRFQFYAQHMQADAMARMLMEADLRVAIEAQAFSLHYQPICSAGGELVGAEALLRWHHPARGNVPPLEFVPVAEDSGLIVPIGAWVLHEVGRQWQRWRACGHPPLRVAVNVSGVQFREGSLSEHLRQMLDACRMPPGCLVLEVNESVLLGGGEIEARMREIKALGVGYAVDDFGTGFSSLSYLKRSPVDTVKIDRRFIDGCADDPDDARLVAAVVNMAHSLGRRVTAEGVETEAQAAFLRDLGCDDLQGGLIGRPMTAEAFEALLGRGRGHAAPEGPEPAAASPAASAPPRT